MHIRAFILSTEQGKTRNIRSGPRPNEDSFLHNLHRLPSRKGKVLLPSGNLTSARGTHRVRKGNPPRQAGNFPSGRGNLPSPSGKPTCTRGMRPFFLQAVPFSPGNLTFPSGKLTSPQKKQLLRSAGHPQTAECTLQRADRPTATRILSQRRLA